MKIYAVVGGERELLATAQSVGGVIIVNGKIYPDGADVYNERNFSEIKEELNENGGDIVSYVERNEKAVFSYLRKMWQKGNVSRGFSVVIQITSVSESKQRAEPRIRSNKSRREKIV